MQNLIYVHKTTLFMGTLIVACSMELLFSEYLNMNFSTELWKPLGGEQASHLLLPSIQSTLELIIAHSLNTNPQDLNKLDKLKLWVPI